MDIGVGGGRRALVLALRSFDDPARGIASTVVGPARFAGGTDDVVGSAAIVAGVSDVGGDHAADAPRGA